MNERNTFTAMAYRSQDFFQTELLGSLANINATSTQYDYATTNAMARWFHVINPRLNLQTTGIYTYYEPRILSPELDSRNKVILRQSILQRQVKSNLNYQLENQKIEFGVNATAWSRASFSPAAARA